LIQTATEIYISIEMSRVGLDRVPIRVAGFCRLVGLERQAVLEPPRVRRRRRRLDDLSRSEKSEPPARGRDLELEHILAVIGAPLRIPLAHDDCVADGPNTQTRHWNFIGKLCAQAAERAQDSRRRNLRFREPLR